MKPASRIKSWKTRADTQRTQAQDIFRSYRGQKTKEAKEARKRARHLLELSERNLKKAEVFNQLINAWNEANEEDLDFDETYIDTVKAKLLNRWGTDYIKTPVAQAILHWIDDRIATYGRGAVVVALQKANSENPYIFDRYIYDSDTDGSLTVETLSILNYYADEYIEGHRDRADNLANARNAAEDLGIDTGEFDTTIGDEGWY